MADRFDADTAVRRAGDGLFDARIDEGWWVAQGPNGGYVAALVLRALQAAVDDPQRAPRTLTLHYTSPPVAGPARVAARVERAGRSLSTASARMEQDGALRVLALAAFSKSREGRTFSDLKMPDVPPPEACARMEPHIEIHRRYDQRWAVGDPPFSGGKRALCGGWIRLAEPRPLDALAVAAFADAFPPAAFSSVRREDIGGPVPTIELTVHFRAALPLSRSKPGDFVLAVFRSETSQEGFLEESGEIWSRDGILLAQSRQLALLT